MHKFGVIPTVDEGALRNVRPALAQAWRSFIDYNPRNGILAVATQLGEVLEIYNLKDRRMLCAWDRMVSRSFRCPGIWYSYGYHGI